MANYPYPFYLYDTNAREYSLRGDGTWQKNEKPEPPTYSISLTYEELKNLRDNKQLKPGCKYRITDYVTTTTQPNTRSAGHPFNIVVEALSKDHLAAEARVVKKVSGGLYLWEKFDYDYKDSGGYGDNAWASYLNDSEGIYFTNGWMITDTLYTPGSLSMENYALALGAIAEVDECETNTYIGSEFNDALVECVLDTISCPNAVDMGNNKELRIYKTDYRGIEGLDPDGGYDPGEFGVPDHWEYYVYVGEFEDTCGIFGGARETVDPYFENADTDAWKIWYCLDNDTDRFYWADGSTGVEYIQGDRIGILYRYEAGDTVCIGDNQQYYAWNDGYSTGYTLDRYPSVDDDICYGLPDVAVPEENVVEYVLNSGPGRGVIYRMIDEWGNDCPYDFKNIQFKRWTVTDIIQTGNRISTSDLNRMKSTFVAPNYALWRRYADTSSNMNYGPLQFIVDSQNSDWYYTFSGCPDGSTKIDDITVVCHNYNIYSDILGAACHYNIIMPYYNYLASDAPSRGYAGRQELNNNVFMEGYRFHNTTLLLYSAGYNIFKLNCKNNTLWSEDCIGNKFFEKSSFNLIGFHTAYTIFKNGADLLSGGKNISVGNNIKNILEGEGIILCEDCNKNYIEGGNNILGSNCENNKIGTHSGGITLGSNCSNNKIESYNNYITLGSNCENNIIKRGNNTITLGSQSKNNIIKNYIHDVSIYAGESNVIGDFCHHIYLGDLYSDPVYNKNSNNIIDPSCHHIYIAFGSNNTLGAGCSNIKLSYDLNSNSSVKNNKFGCNCSSINFNLPGNWDNEYYLIGNNNIFKNNVHNIFLSFCYSCVFGDNCENIYSEDPQYPGDRMIVGDNIEIGNNVSHIRLDCDGYIDSRLKNIKVYSGITGTVNNIKHIPYVDDTSTFKEYKPINSQIITI